MSPRTSNAVETVDGACITVQVNDAATADHKVDLSRWPQRAVLCSRRSESLWPYSCIDWEQAAEELQQDYMSVEFDGVTYWMRA